ncbi:MAG: NDP-sugar synthase, partial [Armatimonadetes bacterium]|nr:NDP-sugar synthase [Armatimonadota bacterium]
MRAVVMAGGEGSRLRPLTCNCPKPLVPVVNKPIMQHILELLRRHGVHEIVVTVHYLGEQIQAAFGDGSGLGLTLHYTHEETPLGTAGAVKLGQQWLQDEPFLIVSGDALTDMNLTALRQFHDQQQAVATLGLVRVSNPLEYGVVVTERDGRIRRFLEKPDWSEVFSDTVNTGIYCLNPEVFDLIPDGVPCDWSKDVFPQLLDAGRPMFGYVSEDYWCDVGSLPVYRQAQADALLKKVRVEMAGEHRGRGLWVASGAVVEEGARVDGPALIGEGARIKAGAVVEEFTVVGNHCRIEPDARVVNTVLWDGVFVGEQARANGAIVGRGTTVGRGAILGDEVVVGERCRIGSGSSLAALVKVWPDKHIESGAHVSSTLVWGTGASGALIRDGAVRGVPNVE